MCVCVAPARVCQAFDDGSALWRETSAYGRNKKGATTGQFLSNYSPQTQPNTFDVWGQAGAAVPHAEETKCQLYALYRRHMWSLHAR